MNTLEYTPTKVIPILQKLNPLWWFGNIDDSIYGPASYQPAMWSWLNTILLSFGLYLPGEIPKWWIALNWFFRNPFHNFTFYVIGACDHKSTSIGKYPADVFAKLGWNFTLVMLTFISLPFVSYKGSTYMWYMGWRSPGGAFGFKFRKVDKSAV